MGAERWIKFASKKEAQKVKDYLGDTEEMGKEGSENCYGYGVWFQWKSATNLEVAYQMGSSQSDFANFVCRELARRFKVTRIGADSVGWYADSDWTSELKGSARQSYGDYGTWAAWIKDYKPEFSFQLRYYQKYLSKSPEEIAAYNTNPELRKVGSYQLPPIDIDKLREEAEFIIQPIRDIEAFAVEAFKKLDERGSHA